jgi:pseudaminic acid biosynthesis-associated methylase
MTPETEQERFWAGEFGDAYTQRNRGAQLQASRTSLWARVLGRCARIDSVTELGANLGLNLMAIRRLLPVARLRGIEINAQAAAELRRNLPEAEVLEASFLERTFDEPSDLAFTCGVLIHVAPAALHAAYDALARSARRYVVLCEYYDPRPVTVPYRGHTERLFKRDFAGEFLDAHSDFRLRDYGFVYHRDPQFPADDFTWFVLERSAP